MCRKAWVKKMNDLISRQTIIDALVKRTHLTWEYLKIIYPMLNVLEELPSAERHGRWIEADDMPRLDNTFSIRCSLCGQLMLAHPNDENPNFCCNCGAKMDEVTE